MNNQPALVNIAYFSGEINKNQICHVDMLQLNPELCQMIHNLVGSSSKSDMQSKQLGAPVDDAGDHFNRVPKVFQVEDTDDLRATSEYQIALELQLWKEQQQQLFLNQVLV